MKKILVTGASGFLGGHVLKILLNKGYDVRALSRSADRTNSSKHLTYIAASVLDLRALRKAMAGCAAVVHLAGMVSRNPADASEMEELHVAGTAKVLEAANREGVRRVVYVSTSGTVAVSANPQSIATEADQYAEHLTRSWPYYASKIRAERIAIDRAKKLQLELIILNPSLLLGPGDERISSTGDVLKFMQGKIPALPSGGLNFVDVRDVAEAVAAAIKKGRRGERYLLGAANWDFRKFFTRIGDLAAKPVPAFTAPKLLTRMAAELTAPIFRRMGYEPPLDPVSVGMSEVFWYLSHDKATQELGFSPRDPNETLWDTLEDLRNRGLA